MTRTEADTTTGFIASDSGIVNERGRCLVDPFVRRWVRRKADRAASRTEYHQPSAFQATKKIVPSAARRPESTKTRERHERRRKHDDEHGHQHGGS